MLARDHQRAPVTPRNPIEWDGDPTIYQAGPSRAATSSSSGCSGARTATRSARCRAHADACAAADRRICQDFLAPPRAARAAGAHRRSATRSRRPPGTATTTTLCSRACRSGAKAGPSRRRRALPAGIGFALGPVVIGGGAAHGQASSESWQPGGRRVAAAEQQSLRDAIRQFGDSVRRLGKHGRHRDVAGGGSRRRLRDRA